MRPAVNLFILSVFVFFAALAPVAQADLASSSHYQIQQVITSGGSRATSTSFQGVSSFGQPATGISSSTSFLLKGGFLYFGAQPSPSPSPSPGPSPSPSPTPSPGSGGGGGGTGYIEQIIKKLFPPRIGCSVDFNGDGRVELVDLSILLFYYGDSGASAGCTDLNGNGVVDFPDVSILMYYWTG